MSLVKKVKQFFHFKPFSPKQRKVLNWWCDTSPVKDMEGIIADGAIRSGKTLSMSLAFVFWAMTNFESQNFAMCGKTIGSFRRNVLFWLKLMLRARGYKVEDHRADNLIIISRGETENYFYVFGGKDERSQDLIQGITLAGAFFDEVALMPESFVNQATGRCSVNGSKFWFNCNPDSPSHWFKVNWIDKRKEKKLIYLHFTMDDNLSLSEEIKERYRNMYVGVFYKRYILGLWCIAEGLVYDMFSKEENVLQEELDTIGDYYVSSDFGIQNATTFLLWRRIAGTDDWLCLKEYYYSGREKSQQKTVGQLVDGLMEMLNGIKPKQVIIDPSAAALKVEVRNRGLHVKDADNDVTNGISDVSTMLQTRRLKFMVCCKYTIKEFGTYVWDQKALDRGEEKVDKESDHCMDAVRYFVKTKRLIKKTRAALDAAVASGNYML